VGALAFSLLAYTWPPWVTQHKHVWLAGENLKLILAELSTLR